MQARLVPKRYPALRCFNTASRSISTHLPGAGTDNPNKYCRDMVQKHDYDSYLASFAYGAKFRDSYFALKAFNTELAMIPDNTSQPMIARMRYQFWKDTVKSVYEDQPPKHPIALALHSGPRAAKVPAYHLQRIIDARIAELNHSTYMTTDSLTAHAESTSSTLLYALLSLLNLSSSHEYSHAASHLGAAITISVLLRALPYHASRRRLVIPVDITSKHGVVQEDVFRYGGESKGLEEAVFEFATLANDHLITARSMFSAKKIPKEAMPVFLSAVPAVNYLQRLEKENFDAFKPDLQRRDWKLPYHFWQANRQQMF